MCVYGVLKSLKSIRGGLDDKLTKSEKESLDLLIQFFSPDSVQCQVIDPDLVEGIVFWNKGNIEKELYHHGYDTEYDDSVDSVMEYLDFESLGMSQASGGWSVVNDAIITADEEGKLKRRY